MVRRIVQAWWLGARHDHRSGRDLQAEHRRRPRQPEPGDHSGAQADTLVRAHDPGMETAGAIPNVAWCEDMHDAMAPTAWSS